MKRLASRILLEIQWQGMVVIIYKTGKGGDVDDSANNVAVKKSPLNEKPAPVVVNEKLQRKSGIQREKARIRQLERRKLSRPKEQHLRMDKGLKDTTMADNIPMIEADKKERPHTQLLLTKGDQPLDPKELAALCRVVVKDFIRQGLKLGDNEKREEVLGVMLREVSFLWLKQKQKTQELNATREMSEKFHRGLILLDCPQAMTEYLAGIGSGSFKTSFEDPLTDSLISLLEKENQEIKTQC